MGLSAGDYGGGSRSLFQLVRKLNRERFQPFFLFPKAGPILPELDRSGIGYEIWGKEHNPYGLFSYTKEVLRTIRFFRSRHIDLLHINHGHFWRPAEFMAARILRIPIIGHYRMIVEKAGPFHKYASVIIANSQYTASHSDTAGIPVKVIYNIINLSRFSGGEDIRPELGINKEDLVVTFLGQIKKVKGIPQFLELARRIPDKNIKFLIAGPIRDMPGEPGGPYSQKSLDTAMRDLENVLYLGYRSDVENVYRASDIVVMPSQWEEPFGLINIEAGAAGKPVVATRSGGIPESIEDGENGFLVDKADIDGIERHVRQLIADPALRQRMGRRGREIVELKFRDTPPREIEQLYDDLIARRPLVSDPYR